MVIWLEGLWELLKTVFIFGSFMLLCFAMMVVIFDVVVVLIATIYERWKGRK